MTYCSKCGHAHEWNGPCPQPNPTPLQSAIDTIIKWSERYPGTRDTFDVLITAIQSATLHSQEIDKVNGELLAENTELKEKLAKRFNKPEQEEFSFHTLLKWADRLVKEYPLYKRFIRGTPLDNDCAVWMVEFARNQLALASIPTTVEEVEREEWRQEKHQLTTTAKKLAEALNGIQDSIIRQVNGDSKSECEDWVTRMNKATEALSLAKQQGLL